MTIKMPIAAAVLHRTAPIWSRNVKETTRINTPVTAIPKRITAVHPPHGGELFAVKARSVVDERVAFTAVRSAREAFERSKYMLVGKNGNHVERDGSPRAAHAPYCRLRSRGRTLGIVDLGTVVIQCAADRRIGNVIGRFGQMVEVAL